MQYQNTYSQARERQGREISVSAFGIEEELCFHCPAFYLQLAFFFFLLAAEAPNKRERMK